MSDEDLLFDQLADVFAAVDAEETDDFSDHDAWGTAALVKELSRLTNLVTGRRETLWPKTQEGRDAHSRRNAIQVELHKREVL